ncbi:HNH endonuclease [Reichenbachiella faecimaris]|uniref:HNH endonuclease n=1 Tax=Reichenbachiella faecimaris TaxID=692418 RepID=A0A1W2G7U9_REIFA|nr:HNH endonuclease signature motif containing protein [Reichenbachiella faecimaris]SMD32755.1 HNH endonuclease [Reichenbachiella faecimaris]
MAKQRKSIPQLLKKRSILQKEIESKCPICDSSDVEHFQIHHIDENPSNNNISNLLLICPTCHSKITKGDLDRIYIEQLKYQVLNAKLKLISVEPSKICSWTKDSNLKTAFWLDDLHDDKSFNPILTFTIKNCGNSSELLEGVSLSANHLPSGLSGIPRAYELKSIGRYPIELPRPDENSTAKFENQIVIPANDFCKIELEVINKFQGNASPITTRKALRFTFNSNELNFEIPVIYLNCNSEDPTYAIVLLS